MKNETQQQAVFRALSLTTYNNALTIGQIADMTGLTRGQVIVNLPHEVKHKKDYKGFSRRYYL